MEVGHANKRSHNDNYLTPLSLNRPSLWLPIIMIGWGVVMIGMGFVQNYTGLLVTRIFLGITYVSRF